MDERALLVHGLHFNTPQSLREQTPYTHIPSGISLASWVRLDNRQELADKLGIPRAELEQISDPELIVHSYLKWQEGCLSHLVGDFSFVLYDAKRQTIFCGRDHMGARPFYYFLSESLFVCATSLSGLQGLESVPLQIEQQWLVDYLTHLSMSFEKTPYRDIQKLPPAHSLTIGPHQETLQHYFQLGMEAPLILKDSRDYVEAYREQLETAIKCRLQSDYPLGAELSGGIDSSTITAYAAKFQASGLDNFHAFAFARSELEPQYILSVSQAWRLPYTHIITNISAEHEKLNNRALSLLGYPVEHRNATFHEPFYKLAETFNIRTLLSGFGGDEFVTTLHGNMVALELLMQHRYGELYHLLPGNRLFRFLRLVQLLRKKIQTRNFKQAEYNPEFFKAWSQHWPLQLVRQPLVERYDLQRRYFDTARFDAGYTDLKRFTLEQRWKPFVSTRMENCSLMAAGRKIDYRWPLLDVRLVNLFLRIPSQEHYFRGMGRYLHRRAIAGTVPDLVTWKKGKSMGDVVTRDRQHEAMNVPASLDVLHPLLAELVDCGKLQGQITQMRTGTDLTDDASWQISRNVNILAALNHWLQNREDLQVDVNTV